MNNIYKVNENEDTIRIPINNEFIEGNLKIIGNSNKLVIFAHGSGSGRHGPRNKFVSGVLNKYGISTLLVDLLTKNEECIDNITAEYRFNTPLLSDRLVLVTEYVLNYPKQKGKVRGIGFFGASTGAAAALIAAEKMQHIVKAVVSRGGRVDLSFSIFIHRKYGLSHIIFSGGERPTGN